MSQSPIATYRRISPNCTAPRNDRIRGVAVHCTAGSPNHTARQIVDGGRFVTPSKSGASCHYAVGGDGSIAQGCLEENRAWCTSHAIDHSIITIEVASDTKGLVVNKAAVDALVELLSDICRRNGIHVLLWKGDKSLMGRWEQQNMVVHRWTAAKSCPGDYLYNLHGELARRVNKELAEKTPPKKEDVLDMSIQEFLDALSPAQAYELLQKAQRYAGELVEPEWSKDEGYWTKAKAEGVINTDTPQALLTRCELAAILGRKGLI